MLFFFLNAATVHTSKPMSGPSFKPLEVHGAIVSCASVFTDPRGRFEVFWEHGSPACPVNSFAPSSAHHSYNRRAGTIRAFHLQHPPFGQAKLVQCVSGRVWDVVVDARPDSPSFRRWDAVELSAGSGATVYIPAGCAHGFAALEDCSTVAYLIQGDYLPDATRVFRWDDPELAIPWPFSEAIISDKDRQAPSFADYLSSLC